MVNSKSDSDVFRVAYRYSPINDKGNELSLLLGAHYTTFDVALGTAAGTPHTTHCSATQEKANCETTAAEWWSWPVPLLLPAGGARPRRACSQQRR